ncbi:MAG: pantoate--beta-alanine ligase [Chloroflexi bacterium]|nr:pantoate--beta-alanine ligase [Chloroflexota bacterium]
MLVVGRVAQVREFVAKTPRPLGLVPTMGALHQGHLALVGAARRQCASVAVSIFVNPTQFGPNEDLTAYPRDMQRDLDLLAPLGVDLVFVPLVEEIYPEGFDTRVEVGQVARRLEGGQRPGHFRGVATVVTKLFNIVRPDMAYFGEKDAQQVRVVKRLARDLDTGVEIVVVPTVREADGLAMSSRNMYLSPAERSAASVLYRALCTAQRLYREGERDAGRIRQAVERVLGAEPLVVAVDYVSVADSETLDELERVDRPTVVSLAVRIGRTRLIDNIALSGV